MQKEQREHPPGMIDILCISLNVNISTSERRFRLNEWCLHYSIQVKCSSTTSPCFEGQPEKQETVLSFDSFRLRDFTIVIIKFAPSYLFSDHAKPVSLNVRNADDWHKKNLNTGKKKVVPGIEPGLAESESAVMTITLHNRTCWMRNPALTLWGLHSLKSSHLHGHL